MKRDQGSECNRRVWNQTINETLLSVLQGISSIQCHKNTRSQYETRGKGGSREKR